MYSERVIAFQLHQLDKNERRSEGKKSQTCVTVEGPYTREELNAILQVCTRPQDKAMIEVLYESACRVGELVSMTFENIKAMTDGVVAAIVSGKTGTRTAFLFESVPALRSWMNHHPIKKGFLWIKYGKPYTRITTTAVYYRVQKLLYQAGIQKPGLGLKKSIVHLSDIVG